MGQCDKTRRDLYLWWNAKLRFAKTRENDATLVRFSSTDNVGVHHATNYRRIFAPFSCAWLAFSFCRSCGSHEYSYRQRAPIMIKQNPKQ
jgi:hypothetical protein